MGWWTSCLNNVKKCIINEINIMMCEESGIRGTVFRFGGRSGCGHRCQVEQ